MDTQLRARIQSKVKDALSVVGDELIIDIGITLYLETQLLILVSGGY